MKTPAAPDPVKTAQAQAGYNQDTATTQQMLNMVNQVTPDGNLTYSKAGEQTYVGSDGQTHTIPTFTATQTLSDSNQRIYDTNQATQEKLATIAGQQTGKIGDLLGTNIDLSAGNIDKYSNTHWQGGFDRTWGNKQNELETSLANQGIKAGSEAYRNAMGDFTTQRQSAEDQYLGDMYNTSIGAISQERSTPINEISALLNGSQVSQPSYVSTPSTNVAGVDYTGQVNSNYQQAVAANNAKMGGLFGALGAGMGMFKFSDRRLKTDIRRIGQHALGIGIYAYRYVWGGPERIGVMADEVRRVRPDAVRHVCGVDLVNYAALGA